MSARPRGFFVSLDGPDGAGKTTQASRLAERLRAEGFDVVACRDPGGTPLGERLRSLLLGHDVAVGLRAEMLLYMAGRAQLVEEVIAPALAAGRLVVCDRYLLANVVYQGFAGGLDPQEIWRVGNSATGGLMPDLTLVLDLPTATAAARLGARGPLDRMESRPTDYRERVRSGFHQALQTYEYPYRIIDAAADADHVASAVYEEVSRALRAGARA